MHPIITELWPLGPNAPFDARLAATYKAYEIGTGNKITQPLDTTTQKAIRKWLLKQEYSTPINELGHSIALLYQKVDYTKPLIHLDAAAKASWLSQAPCLTCIPNNSSPAKPIRLSIRTKPFSAQSLAKKKASLQALKEKVRKCVQEKLKDNNDWSGTEICITVVAVVGVRERKKDIDNLVKGLLDALEGTVFHNDNLISHLSVHRFTHLGDEGYYVAFVRPIVNQLADVIYPEVKVEWLGMPMISI